MLGLSRRTFLGGAAAALAATTAGGLSRRAQAAEPIKLGASLSLTGRFSDSAKYVQEGYVLWSEEINAKGGYIG
jgi:branched-chain amino acid transport system substrate-binding protein